MHTQLSSSQRSIVYVLQTLIVLFYHAIHDLIGSPSSIVVLVWHSHCGWRPFMGQSLQIINPTRGPIRSVLRVFELNLVEK